MTLYKMCTWIPAHVGEHMHRHNVWIHSHTCLLTHTDRCITHKQIYITYRHMHHTCIYIHTQTLMLIKIYGHMGTYMHTHVRHIHMPHICMHMRAYTPNIQIYMLRRAPTRVHTHVFTHVWTQCMHTCAQQTFTPISEWDLFIYWLIK